MLKIILHLLRSVFRSRQSLALENLALRHQLHVLQRPRSRISLKKRDRLFWVVLSRIWADWRKPLTIVQPETVVRWHRQGFRLYWRWKSRDRGRPQASPEIRELVRRMAFGNPLWGAPRIHGEMLKLGLDVAQATVSRYMPRGRRPPSQSWGTFLKNHAAAIASIDFFTVPTATFRVLYVFVILSHERRRVVHFNVTDSPTPKWTARQLVHAFPWDTAPRFLLRDRDAIYGPEFLRSISNLGIEDVRTSPRCPWQNPYVERLIGSIRRECLDHVVIVNEDHLRGVLREYLGYYSEARTHLGLGKDCPEARAVEPPEAGRVVALPRVGGLHHRYTRRAA
jgi:transposase InsO family protein